MGLGSIVLAYLIGVPEGVFMVEVHGLKVDSALFELVKSIADEAGLSSDAFWQSFEAIVSELGPENKALLAERDTFQEKLDAWFKAQPKGQINVAAQKQFLLDIGYLLAEGVDFKIDVTQVDSEITVVSGPQLVVPMQNARFALNAANARWGSLYDALYGTDVIDSEGGAEAGAAYNPVRGAKVVAFAKAFLDETVPLKDAKFGDVTGFEVVNGELSVDVKGTKTSLKDASQFVGYAGDASKPSSILLKNNGLHIEIQIDANHQIGESDPAHIKDIVLEAAITTIQDFEDSVAVVDAEDKVLVYKNWLGLITGDLEESFEKNGKLMTRRLNPDKSFTAKDGSELSLAGRSLLFARNVGIHMYTDAVLYNDEEIPEGFLDTVMTALISKKDVEKKNLLSNSRTGSIYIVKPKQHGPKEVAFTVKLFEQVEKALSLAENTLKIGIMDEERRTTLNLKECIRAAKNRIVFTNTGFLDRTGDDIHTVMEAGPVAPKGEIKNAAWITAYEDWNVDIALETGMRGKAQIGKGMWAKPDAMKEMLDAKIGHPLSGASTAWVPSPTAATLHAMHYHKVNVANRQEELELRERASLDDLLTPALLSRALSSEEVQQELDNNIQGTLGYVSRWVGQGIGCSKVPDINNVGLMEDRATLRISSQHIANWLHHGVTTEAQVMATLEKMAAVVDEQNKHDANYHPMTPNTEASLSFQAAKDLIFKGRIEANGYTETVLHSKRRKAKAG